MKLKLLVDIPVSKDQNLTAGTIVDRCPCPREYRTRLGHAFWVMGDIKPVRLFGREFEVVEE